VPDDSSPKVSSESSSLPWPARRLTVRTAVERARVLLSGLAWHLGLGRRSRIDRIDTAAKLRDFIDSHASHVAQTSLYGYLKARAGTRFPDLFEHDAFLVSINHAKWQVWATTLSDLTVFAGGLVQRRSGMRGNEVDLLMDWVVEDILARTGTPPDSGPDFPSSIDKLRLRIAECDFSRVTDDADSFTESPESLVLFAPIIEKYKQLDAEIVRNSVRFRWIEVRRTLRSLLDAEAVVDEFKTSSEQDSAIDS
jgi:hypothetical protein